MDEASRDKHVVGLKTRNAAIDATEAHIDDMARGGVTIKCISGDGAGEFGWSVSFHRMLANRGIKWRCPYPGTSQSSGIAERAIQQLLKIHVDNW